MHTSFSRDVVCSAQRKILRTGWILSILVVTALACDTTQINPSQDGGSSPTDAGPADAGRNDAGLLDAGRNDAGLLDAGPADGGAFVLGDARISALTYTPPYALVADGETSFRVAISVIDAAGNPLPDVEIRWQSEISDVQFSASSRTDASGLANVQISSSVAGDIPVFATLSYQGESLNVPSIDLPFIPCHSPQDQFLSETYGAVFTRCLGCHNEYGLAKNYGLSFQLKMPGDENFATDDIAMLAELAEPIISVEGGARMMSRLLAKPLGIADEGHMGGQVVVEGGAEHRALESLVHRLQNPDACDATSSVNLFAGVSLRTPRETYARAKLTLTGQVATPEELTGMADTETALDEKLDSLLTENAFDERLQEIANDWLLTDGERNILNRIPRLMYPRQNFYREMVANRACVPTTEGGPGCCSEERDEAFCAAGRRLVDLHATREPLELISWLIRQDRSMKEMLTYDRLRVSPFTAYVYGVDHLVDFPAVLNENARRPVRIQDTNNNNIARNKAGAREIPHSGILTTNALLNRYPSTDSNRQRTRAARLVLEKFLAVPVGDFADFVTTGLDPNADLENATQTAMPCIVCHTAMDPIAGNFDAFRSQGAFTPNRPWPDYLPAPAFGDQIAPENTDLLPWLAAQVVEHPRYAYGIILPFFEGLTGISILKPPLELQDPHFQAKSRAFRAQNEYLMTLTQQLMDTHDFRLKPVLKAILKGPWFRAKNALNEDDELQDATRLAAGIGGGIALTNEQLDRKIESVTGYPWRRNGAFTALPQLDRNIYGILYGGIDSNEINQRYRAHFALQLGIVRRMANEMACMAIPRDFSLTDANARRLLPGIELDTTEISAPQTIRNTIRRLLLLVWGEDLDASDPEVERAFQLFIDARTAGLAAIENGSSQTRIPARCRVVRSYAPPGETVDYPANPGPEDAHRRVVLDPNYTVRSWMALFTYLLSDPKFFQDG